MSAKSPERGGLPPSLSRRRLLLALGLGAGVGAGARALHARVDPAPPWLRPPGAVPEPEFLNQCIRCGACFHACPTGTLKPSGVAQPLLGFGTPLLEAREGGCAYGCNACGEACPTQAIAPLPLAEKQRLKMGVAEITAARCLPYAQGQPCTLCVAACPYEAIRWLESGRADAWGNPLRLPLVEPDKCTGCGLCEADCPVDGAAAIQVRAEYPRRPLPVPPRRQRQAAAPGPYAYFATAFAEEEVSTASAADSPRS